MEEKQVQKLVNALHCSQEEALQIIADDKRIDKGEKLFELNAEQEKASKQARQADRKPTVYKLDNEKGKRSKKADNDKAFLLNELFKAILPNCETYEIQNGEREFTFTYHEKKYKVVLSAPRS
jgi:hypothetical protein